MFELYKIVSDEDGETYFIGFSEPFDFCACCGHESDGQEFCRFCQPHIDLRADLPAEQRTYMARYGLRCPLTDEYWLNGVPESHWQKEFAEDGELSHPV